jgi:hypothetical protein
MTIKCEEVDWCLENREPKPRKLQVESPEGSHALGKKVGSAYWSMMSKDTGMSHFIWIEKYHRLGYL